MARRSCSWLVSVSVWDLHISQVWVSREQSSVSRTWGEPSFLDLASHIHIGWWGCGKWHLWWGAGGGLGRRKEVESSSHRSGKPVEAAGVLTPPLVWLAGLQRQKSVRRRQLICMVVAAGFLLAGETSCRGRIWKIVGLRRSLGIGVFWWERSRSK